MPRQYKQIHFVLGQIIYINKLKFSLNQNLFKYCDTIYQDVTKNVYFVNKGMLKLPHPSHVMYFCNFVFEKLKHINSYCFKTC